MRNAEYYKSRIQALQEEAAIAPLTDDDLERLAMYREELAEIEKRTTISKVQEDK